MADARQLPSLFLALSTLLYNLSYARHISMYVRAGSRRFESTGHRGQLSIPAFLPMRHFQFRWVLRDQQYVFTAIAQTSRAQQAEVEAEIAEIWAWLQRQKLRPGKFGWEATRKTQTTKIETLTVNRGAVESDGETIFHPQETRLVLTLPDMVAVNFRFEFNVVDDRA
ncbi:hypothetical protein [Acidovorax sp.]|uniref:hypothetical protein n=1 Tax=Acidovorax sp. TaxID=1872122 RepID=UPI00391F4011